MMVEIALGFSILSLVLSIVTLYMQMVRP